MEDTHETWTLDAFDDYEDGTNMEVLDPQGFPVAIVEASPILNRWNERFPEMGHWAEGARDGRTERKIPRNKQLARARLIAAAPELLEACERALEFLEPFDQPGLSLGLGSEALTQIRAAIAKALGGDKSAAAAGHRVTK